MQLPIAYSFLSATVRWKSTLLALLGIGLVVAVFVGLLAMASGFRLALRASGRPGNTIVLQKGALSELGSSFSKAAGDWVADDPRIARNRDGAPLVSPELVAVVALPNRSNGDLDNVGVRGITPTAFVVREEVNIIAGRRVQPGPFEVMVGKQARNHIRGLEVGSRILLMNRTFEVVGIFSDQDSSFESEIWADFDAMASAFNRAGTENSVTLRLADWNALPAFDRELEANLQYPLWMTNERKYYEDQAGPLSKFLTGLAAFVAVVMGIGAAFGAMNTMYAIVAQRTREIGTLRALGFSRNSVLMVFALEGFLLAVAGGALGCLLSLLADGLTATSTTASMSEIAFAFRVTPTDLGYGLLFAVTIGVLGSFLPALRAARLPVTAALRET